MPAVEVHLSDVDSREELRRHSVIADLVIGRVSGKGVDGYREALGASRQETGRHATGGGMTSRRERAERLVGLLDERGLDLLLVTNLVNVRYLSGFTGTNGVCLIGPQRPRLHNRLSLRRALEPEVPDFERLRGKQDLLGDVAEALVARSERRRAARLRGGHLTVARHERLRELLPEQVRAGAGERAWSSACGP